MTLFGGLRELLGDGPKTYESLPNTYWMGLDNLKLAVSPRVGLESHLDGFVAAGKVKIEEADVFYRIEHEKHSMWGWQMNVAADTPEVLAKVEEVVMGLIGNRKTPPRNGKIYIDPQGKPSTGEIINMIEAYQKNLEK